MSMTKMDNACTLQADNCDLNGDGFYILDALNAGNKALELLAELHYGKESSYLNTQIYNLLEEWN